MKYTSIFLLGPRTSGKSTIGRRLADHLGWKLVEMDEEIRTHTSKSVDEITNHGTNWSPFRQLEIDLVKELLKRENIAVSCGGGFGVNNIIDRETGKSFGELGKVILTNAPNVLKVVLLPNESSFVQRITQIENAVYADWRPILDEKHAAEAKKMLEEHTGNPIKQKKIIIQERVLNNITMYKLRKPLYGKLSQHIIDTGKLDIYKSIAELLNLFA